MITALEILCDLATPHDIQARVILVVSELEKGDLTWRTWNCGWWVVIQTRITPTAWEFLVGSVQHILQVAYRHGSAIHNRTNLMLFR